MKPVGLLGYTFLLAFLDLTAHNVQQHSYHFELLTNRNIVLIYSVTIFEQKKQRIVHGQGASEINYSTVVFNFDICRLS